MEVETQVGASREVCGRGFMLKISGVFKDFVGGEAFLKQNKIYIYVYIYIY